MSSCLMFISLHFIKASRNMKIFSWVHRQLLCKATKKDDNDDKVTLLENEANNIASGWDGWNDGILTIGTLGLDLFQDFKTQQGTFMNNPVLFLDDASDVYDGHDEEMGSSLARKVSSHCAFGHVEKHNLSPCAEVAKPNKHQEDDDVVVVKDSTKVKKSEGRITLADLLRADPENNLLKKDELSKSNNDGTSNSNINSNSESIKSFPVSKAKKKLGKDGFAQPIKKTTQLMRKMLRNSKKIHPDIGIQKESSSIVGHVHAT